MGSESALHKNPVPEDLLGQPAVYPLQFVSEPNWEKERC
jgi:hypothetical protein